ncbi:MAG: hypothetical protein WAV78_37630, partial [Xanthobacteraceae bacterium]
ACPLSGRNSTYRSVQISETSSNNADVPEAPPRLNYARRLKSWHRNFHEALSFATFGASNTETSRK